MAIPNPNPNIEDGALRDNKTWSSNKIASEIETSSGGGVPTPAAGDAGKFLRVNEDKEYSLETVYTLNEYTSSGVLEAGETEITIEGSFDTDTLIDVFTSIDGVEPSSMLITEGEVTLTFAEQASDMTVILRHFAFTPVV